MTKEEIKYYIIKDLKTGLYYRGKGQNRWGKYYNQASIFRNLAQANNSSEYLKLYDESDVVVIEIKINEKTITQPLYKDDGTGDHYYFCGNCNVRIPLCSNLIDQIKYKHCPYCGEQIDWSDENDK